jgi:HSP20 family protein
MNYIIRRDPLREMMTLRSAMDRMFDTAFLGEQGEWPDFVDTLPLDVSETEDEYVVKASIPGIKPDDLEITYSSKTLTIKGEFKAEQEKDDMHYHLRERRYGAFARSLTLPAAVKSEAIEARYESGVLTLKLPKTEEVKPKKIAVHSAEAPSMIEGKVKEVANKN